MVSVLSIIMMVISAVISLGIPLVVLVYTIKNKKVSMLPLLMGMVTFMIFPSLILNVSQATVLSIKGLGNLILGSKVASIITAGILTGVITEGGRFIMAKFGLKKNRSWSDALSFGIGMATMDAFYSSFSASVQNIIYSSMINKGTFATSFQESIPAEMIDALKTSIVSASPAQFLTVGGESIFLFVFAILMTMVVFYGIKENKGIYLLYAMLLHSGIKIAIALIESITFGYIIVWPIIIVAVYFMVKVILKSEDIYNNETKLSLK